MKIKLTIFVVVLILFALTGCCFSSGSSTTAKNTTTETTVAGTIEEELKFFYENFHAIAQAYDTENQKLCQDFESLDNTNDRIKNIQTRIENIKDFRYKLTTLNIPEPLKEFYEIKLQELQVSEDLGEASISYMGTGSPPVEELEDYQNKVNELSIKSYNLAMEIYKKYNLSYLIK